MGAKFKAPLDSRCFADMEEVHFLLPLPPCVCLSFALLSFNSSPPSIAHSLLPSIISHPRFLWEDPLALLSFGPFSLTSFSFPFPLALALSPPLISFSVFDSTVHSVLCSPLVLALSLFVSQSSFHHIFQSFKSDRHWSVRNSRDAVRVQVCSESSI